MSELKPCPFCGQQIDMDFTNVTAPLFVWDRVELRHTNCLASIRGYSVEEVIHDWNTRPIEDELRAELEKRTAELHYANAVCMEMKHELARRDEELKITDGLLKEATETIGAVVACCTYNSNEDAKIGIYGIDQKAFTRIDQFITHYNDAVSSGKVSVDVKPVKRENDYQNDNRTNTGG